MRILPLYLFISGNLGRILRQLFFITPFIVSFIIAVGVGDLVADGRNAGVTVVVDVEVDCGNIPGVFVIAGNRVVCRTRGLSVAGPA
jgi:hypothetical protein